MITYNIMINLSHELQDNKNKTFECTQIYLVFINYQKIKKIETKRIFSLKQARTFKNLMMNVKIIY